MEEKRQAIMMIPTEEWNHTQQMLAQISQQVEKITKVMTGHDSNELLSPKEVCRILKIGRSTFERYAKNGILKITRINKEKYAKVYVKRSDMEDYQSSTDN